MTSKQRRMLVVMVLALTTGILFWSRPRERSAEPSQRQPIDVDRADAAVTSITMEQVLELAAESRRRMVEEVDDYTARFEQQERDAAGVLGPRTVMEMKLQTPHRGGEEGSPMRVYLKFVEPEAQAGREVIWAEDLHDGKLIVHEAGLLGLVPIPPLDPNGMIAMRGQRYPISEIGLTNLIDKLLERGEADRDNAKVKASLSEGHFIDETPVSLIRVERAEPSPGPNDFSVAEIRFDPARKLVLGYRSFGWPNGDEPPPLLESYTYHDLRTNVGLTEADFDPRNPAYKYP